MARRKFRRKEAGRLLPGPHSSATRPATQINTKLLAEGGMSYAGQEPERTICNDAEPGAARHGAYGSGLQGAGRIVKRSGDTGGLGGPGFRVAANADEAG